MLNKSSKLEVNGISIDSFYWIDDGEEDSMALRIDTPQEPILIYHTDKIAKVPTGVLVTIGAKDYLFSL